MSISSDSSPDEFTSPFFIQNKEICYRWGDLIRKFNGKVNGKYTSWSYRIIGHIKTNYSWRIEVSKSTYSATGISSLLHSNVFENLSISTDTFDSKGSSFYIRKRNLFFDIFIRNKFKQELINNYILIGSNKIENKVSKLLNYLSETVDLKNLYRIEVEGNVLNINIQSYNNCHRLISDLMIWSNK